MGPQGTGGLYVGERADIKPFKSGGTGVLSFLAVSYTHLDVYKRQDCVIRFTGAAGSQVFAVVL